MEILALIGSPRKGGNSDVLVDALLDVAHANAHQTRKIYLYDHTIQPCIDCRACKAGEQVCVLPDDMSSIYDAIDAADTIIFATPVYWFGPTGPMKLVLDRLRPYFGNRRLEGKKAILVAPAGDGPQVADLLREMFRRSCGFLGMEWRGEVLGTAYDRGDIARNSAAMETAASLGTNL